MKLSELVQNLSETRIQVTGQILDMDILGVTADTREVQPGFLYVAIRGAQKDGHDLIPTALKNGAVFVVGEDLNKLKNYDASLPGFKDRWLHAPSGRRGLDLLAQKFYGNPSANLFCVGVTGTNGKTSVSYMLEHVFNSAGLPTGVMGTINHHFREKIWPSAMTTPDPVALQRRLKEFKSEGARAVAMEVSSHALDQHRADGVHFNTVIFTNLTRDHLDYHQSMANYFAAKQRLFSELLWSSSKPARWGIINIDDPWGRRLRVASGASVYSFGQGPADFQFEVIRVDFAQTIFEIKTSSAKIRTSIPMCGLHNVYNAVAVIAAAATASILPFRSAEILSKFQGVPGRMQLVPNSRSLNIFIDYAHSPDALKNVLLALQNVRKLSNSGGKIWTVFGCGGDRDQGKRPLMAQCAEKYSDHVMITSDNPRTEDLNKILDDIAVGFSGSQKFQRQPDRRSAIAEIIKMAKPGDVVLIAGKGHEDYQIVGETKNYFSDVGVVKEILG
jgi:UDP-N-acetylmuramoyl-L-alanyl-D-glutamate--2,6-diaminopimelate ligase